MPVIVDLDDTRLDDRGAQQLYLEALFHTYRTDVPEVMVDPKFQRQGIGRALMHRALALAPGGRLFFGAQAGNEAFFERAGFRPGPTGFVGAHDRASAV